MLYQPDSSANLRGVLPGFFQEFADLHNLGAKVGDARLLGGIGILRQINTRPDVLHERGVGDSRAVIPRAAGYHAG